MFLKPLALNVDHNNVIFVDVHKNEFRVELTSLNLNILADGQWQLIQVGLIKVLQYIAAKQYNGQKTFHGKNYLNLYYITDCIQDFKIHKFKYKMVANLIYLNLKPHFYAELKELVERFVKNVISQPKYKPSSWRILYYYINVFSKAREAFFLYILKIITDFILKWLLQYE